MGRLFFDTSALIKRYVDESGSNEIRQMMKKDNLQLVLSTITTFEIKVCFSRMLSDGRLDSNEFSRCVSRWQLDRVDTEFVELDLVLETAVAEIAQTQTLKTLDMIQLASALLAQPDMFVTGDKKLHQAAIAVLSETDVQLV